MCLLKQGGYYFSAILNQGLGEVLTQHNAGKKRLRLRKDHPIFDWHNFIRNIRMLYLVVV